MAKISAQERAKKKQQLDDIVLSIFWERGWHAISYASVAEAYGCSRGAIQRYFPHHLDFAESIKGKVLPLIMSNLNWESKEALHKSWIDALYSEDVRFRRVMELLISQVSQETPAEQTTIGVNNFLSIIEQKFGDKQLGKILFGETFLALLNIRRD